MRIAVTARQNKRSRSRRIDPRCSVFRVSNHKDARALRIGELGTLRKGKDCYVHEFLRVAFIGYTCAGLSHR